mmetsp:Transcript_11697/g.25268  ORF Transcript_11697/g.25268 Transcript_11697/m.25268 type:complete len:204 (-) Transcript_11697:191-802(-)|eukprot:1490888-Pleurochrysis_carterae.AAC.2
MLLHHVHALEVVNRERRRNLETQDALGAKRLCVLAQTDGANPLGSCCGQVCSASAAATPAGGVLRHARVANALRLRIVAVGLARCSAHSTCAELQAVVELVVVELLADRHRLDRKAAERIAPVADEPAEGRACALVRRRRSRPFDDHAALRTALLPLLHALQLLLLLEGERDTRLLLVWRRRHVHASPIVRRQPLQAPRHMSE